MRVRVHVVSGHRVIYERAKAHTGIHCTVQYTVLYYRTFADRHLVFVEERGIK